MLQLHLFPTYLFVTFCHNYSVKKYSLQSLVWHQSCLVLLALHCICYCRIPIDTTDEERCTRDDLIFREFHKSVHHLFVLEFFVVNFFLANCSFDISWIKKQKCKKKNKKKCCRKKSLRRWKGGIIGWHFAQEGERVVQNLEGRWFDSQDPLAAGWSIREQETEPWIAPDEQVGTWHGSSLLHQCVNGWIVLNQYIGKRVKAMQRKKIEIEK